MTLSELEHQTQAVAEQYLDGAITMKEYYHKIWHMSTLNENMIEAQDLEDSKEGI